MSKGLGDKIKGNVSKAKGEVKDQVGNATNNRDLQREGKAEKTKRKCSKSGRRNKRYI